MTLVLSNSENIQMLLFWLKLAAALSAIAIALLLLFWFRLKKIEHHIHINKKHLKSVSAQKNPQKTGISTPFRSNHPTNLAIAPKSLRKSPKHFGNSRWLLAIAIASFTGIAIALVQLGNILISPEYTTIIWLFIGVGLVIGATYAF